MEGSLRFWSGGNPYATPEIGDVFHYSPLFAAFYGIFAYASHQIHLTLWAALNSFVLCFGINQWVKWDKKMGFWLWLALAAMLMELDISQRYHQANALIIGITLWGMALYKEKNFFAAGVILALGINIKIIPILFALPLLWPLNRNYILGLLSGLFLFFILPILFVGWERNLYLHQQQFAAIFSDLEHRKMLDIKNVLLRLEYDRIAEPVQIAITGIFVWVFCLSRFIFKNNFPWASWISFGVASCLLLSPRTESPTFVLLAPCYLLLMPEKSVSEKSITAIAFFFISIVFTAVWDPFFHLSIQNNYVSKVMGTFLIWALCAGQLIWGFIQTRRETTRLIEIHA